MEPANKEESEDQYEQEDFALPDDHDEDDGDEYTMGSASKETSQKPSTDQEQNVFVQVRQQEATEEEDSSDVKSPLNAKITGAFGGVKLNTESEKNISNGLTNNSLSQVSKKPSAQYSSPEKAQVQTSEKEDEDDDYEDDDYEEDNQYEDDDGFDEESSSQPETAKPAPLAKPT